MSTPEQELQILRVQVSEMGNAIKVLQEKNRRQTEVLHCLAGHKNPEDLFRKYKM